VPDQLIEGPGAQRFVTRLVGEQVVRTQVLETVGELPRGFWGRLQRALCGRATRPAVANRLNDGDIEQLTVQRQLLLQLDSPGGAREDFRYE